MNNAWKIACATLVIFIAGIVTGAALVRFALVRQNPWWIQRPVVNVPGRPNPVTPINLNQPNEPRLPNTGPQGLLSREFIQVLERHLQLTPEQRARIDRIMADGQERVRELRARIDPEMRKELQQTREQIRAVLTPEQREQFEQLMKRSQRRNNSGEAPGQPERDRRSREPRNPPPPLNAPLPPPEGSAPPPPP